MGLRYIKTCPTFLLIPNDRLLRKQRGKYNYELSSVFFLFILIIFLIFCSNRYADRVQHNLERKQFLADNQMPRDELSSKNVFGDNDDDEEGDDDDEDA